MKVGAANVNGNGSAPRTHGGVAMPAASAEGAAEGDGLAPDASAPDAAPAAGGASAESAPVAPSADAPSTPAAGAPVRTHGGKPATDTKTDAEKAAAGAKPGAAGGKPKEEVSKNLAALQAKQREIIAAQVETKKLRDEVDAKHREIDARAAKIAPLEALLPRLRNVHEDPMGALDALEAAGVDPVVFIKAVSRAPAKKPDPTKDVASAVREALEKHTAESSAKAEADKKAAEEKKAAEDKARQEAIEEAKAQVASAMAVVVESEADAYPLLSMEDPEEIGVLCYEVLEGHVRGLVAGGKRPEAEAIVAKLQSGEEEAKIEVYALAARLTEAALVQQHKQREQRIAPSRSNGTTPAPGNGQRTNATLSSKTVPSSAPRAPTGARPGDESWDSRVQRAAARLNMGTPSKK